MYLISAVLVCEHTPVVMLVRNNVTIMGVLWEAGGLTPKDGGWLVGHRTYSSPNICPRNWITVLMALFSEAMVYYVYGLCQYQ